MAARVLDRSTAEQAHALTPAGRKPRVREPDHAFLTLRGTPLVSIILRRIAPPHTLDLMFTSAAKAKIGKAIALYQPTALQSLGASYGYGLAARAARRLRTGGS
jgi:hypothetical protein